jgi:hypothetical protein
MNTTRRLAANGTTPKRSHRSVQPIIISSKAPKILKSAQGKLGEFRPPKGTHLQ